MDTSWQIGGFQARLEIVTRSQVLARLSYDRTFDMGSSIGL